MRINGSTSLIELTLPALSILGRAGITINYPVLDLDGMNELKGKGEFEYSFLQYLFTHMPVPIKHIPELPSTIIKEAIDSLNFITSEGLNRDDYEEVRRDFSEKLLLILYPQLKQFDNVKWFKIVDNGKEILSKLGESKCLTLSESCNSFTIDVLESAIDNLIEGTDISVDLKIKYELHNRNKELLNSVDFKIPEKSFSIDGYIAGVCPQILSQESLEAQCAIMKIKEQYDTLSYRVIQKVINRRNLE